MRSKKDNESMMELFNKAKVINPIRAVTLYEMFIMGSISADEFKYELQLIVRDWYE